MTHTSTHARHAEILHATMPVVGDKHRDEPGYRYRDPNGRTFFIWDMRERYIGTNKRYFMEEMRPNGRVVTVTKTHVEARDDATVQRLLDSPNDFARRLRRAGGDPDALIKCGSGSGVYTRYFKSLADCADAIACHLAANEW